MQNARHLLENMLAKGKLEAAIEGCLILCRHYGDKERSADAAQHSARYHALMDDYHAGTLGDDDYRLQRARINRAMLELAHEIPIEWTDEALQRAGFSARSFDKATVSKPGSFRQKWGLVLGAIAIVIVAGFALKKMIAPRNERPPVSKAIEPPAADTQNQAEAKPTKPEPKPTTPIKSNSNSSGTKATDGSATQTRPTLRTQPINIPKIDGRFRSFANMQIKDGMERGYMDGKIAFRNVRTKEIICCFSDGEDFSGGKAYVSKDGVNYYYMDKFGNKVGN